MTTPFNAGNSFVIDASQGLDPETLKAAIAGITSTNIQSEGDTWKKKAEVTPKGTEGALVLTKKQLAEVIEYQIKEMIERFKRGYNKANTTGHMDYRIAMNTVDRDSTTIKVLEISLIINGSAHMLFRTAYSFSHPTQVENEGEWKLAMWSEALYNLIGGSIAYGISLAKSA